MSFDITNIDWDEYLEGAQAYAGDEGRALAENIARNLTESVRQSRNALEAAVNARKTKAEVADATSLEMSAQTERNAEASFTTHLKAIQRGVANELGQKLRAREFMGIKFEGPFSSTGVPPVPSGGGKATGETPVVQRTGETPVVQRTGETPVVQRTGETPVVQRTGETPVVLTLDEFAAQNHANLGPHPHSNLLAVPLPPGYEDVKEYAAKLVNLPVKERTAALAEMLKAKAQGRDLPPPPEPPAQPPPTPPAPPVAGIAADGEGFGRPDRPAVLTEELQKIAETIRDKNREHVAILNGAGESLFRKVGRKSDAYVPTDILKDATLIHNHPSGIPPSKDDTRLILEHGLKENWIVGIEYDYAISLKPGVNQGFYSKFRNLYEAEFAIAKKTYSDLIGAGINKRQAQIAALDKMWQNLAENPDCVIQYQRRPHYGK